MRIATRVVFSLQRATYFMTLSNGPMVKTNPPYIVLCDATVDLFTRPTPYHIML